MSFRRVLALILFFVLMFVAGALILTKDPKPLAPLPTFSDFKTISTDSAKKLSAATPARPTGTPVGVATPTSTSTPTKIPTWHTVEPGETLSEIAARYGIDLLSLAHANNLADPNYIEAGQVLLITTIPVTKPAPSGTEKQIIVILSEQKTYVYENTELIKTFVISSGLPAFPTITGPYRIKTKLELDDMSGPDYYIKDVQWVMYFHLGYSFHGTTWHNNFGTPMSHGCLNMTVADADWLYHWAEVGTLVTIYP